MTKILIVGCGDIGSRLAGKLSGQGHEILGIRRNPPVSCDKNFKFKAVNILNTKELGQLNRDFSTVFYMPSPDRGNLGSYEEIYIRGLGDLLDFFEGAIRPPHFFFISSTSVYGQRQGEWVDEESAATPDRETGWAIVAGEQLIWQHNPKNTVVRFSGIYGPGRSHLIRKLESDHKIQYDPPYFTNRIHQDDCAAVLSFLFNKLINGEQLQPCYLASDDEPAPIWDVLTWLADRIGKPYPQRLKKEAGANKNKRCRNNRLKQMGYRFHYPNYRAGYEPLIDAELNSQ